MHTDILEMLKGGTAGIARLRELLAQMNTADIAEIFDYASQEEAVRLFRLLPKNIAAETFADISTEKQQLIIEWLTDSEVGLIMNDLFVDDLADFVEEVPALVVNRVLNNVSSEKRRLVNQILNYPKDSAGSVMTTEYVELAADCTVRQALDFIRETGVDKETIYTCYITETDYSYYKKLIGAVSVDALLHAEPLQIIGEIMEENVIFAHTTEDRETVAGIFRKYGLLALPVVDNEEQLVGIVTVDDVLEIIAEETTEDFAKMAAMHPTDELYLKSSALHQAKNRFGWLLLLMLSATINGSIIASFESALMILPAMVAFIPMLMGAGGNASVQSSTVIIRGMALGEINYKDVVKVMWMEMRIGLVCGLGLGFANFARIFLMNGKDALMSLVVTCSLCATLIISKIIGCTLPIGAKKLKLDPAIAAAPIITTVVDCTTLLVFFSIVRAVYHI
ncbi:MAG: magnesium transporter [Firmicutes bacterium]|nr:magnesium transporter [Bacillota bacterium]